MMRRLKLRILGVRCREVVGWLTDYLEGSLDPAMTAALDRHFDHCDGCAAALDQFRRTIAVAGELSTADVAVLPPAVRVELRAAFEAHRR